MNIYRTLHRKIIRDLWRHRSRTLLVALSVMVGVLGIGMIVDTRDVLTTDLRRRYAAIQPAHIEIGVPAGVPVDDLKGLESIPGVTAVQGRAVHAIRYRDRDGQWQALEVLAFPDPEAQRINRITPEAGKWPPARREISVERASLTGMGLQVGDTLTVDAQGREMALQIVGTMHQQDNFTLAVRGTASAVVSLDTMVQLRGHDRFNVIYLTVDDLTRREAMGEAARKRLERAGYPVDRITLKDPSRHIAQDIVDILLLIMGILGVLVLALSGFLVTNTISALIAQQIDQIGIMKAIGADGRIILGLYGLIVLAYSALGTLLALPLASRMGYRLADVIAGRLNIDLYPYRPSPTAWLVMALVGLLVPFAAAGGPLWRGAHITVREAIADYGLGGSRGDNRVVGLLLRVQNVPRTWSLALRNSARVPSRLALTVLTLALAGATFIAVLSTRASFNRTLDSVIGGQYGIDALFVFEQEERISVLVPLVESHPEVVRGEGWVFDQATMTVPSGQEVEVTLFAGPHDTQFFRPRLERGRWLRPEDTDAIVLNRRWADEEGVTVGDRVTLHIAGQESEWTVVGFNRDLTQRRTGVYVTFEELNRVQKRRDRTYTLMLEYTAHDGQSQERISADLIEMLAGRDMDVFSSETMARIRGQATELYNILIFFLLTMSLLLAVVGGLGLMGTMSISVLERSKEIGVMRAIGADNRTIVEIFWGESMAISLFSSLLAVALSAPLSRWMARVVGIAFTNTPLDFAYAYSSVAAWLTIALVVGTLASIAPALNAAHLSVQESLSYE